MNKQRPAPAANAAEAEERANARLLPQLDMMARALWASPVRNTLFLFSACIFFVVAATAYGQIRLNDWNKPFYDALSHKDFAQFLAATGCIWIDCRNAAGPQCGPALARRDPQDQAASRPGAGLDTKLAGTRPGLSADQRGTDGRESGPAHARRCAPPDRAVHGPWHRTSAIVDSARELREGTLGPVQ